MANTMERPRPSTVGWALLIGGVALWDFLCPEGETLSEGVDHALEHPIGKYFALGGIAVTAAHLANVLPDNIDPIHQLVRFKDGRAVR